MISQTKKAKEVRRYYLSLERLVKKYFILIQDRLNSQIGLLKTNQKPKVNVKGGVIYVVKALNSNESVYKLGKSTDLKKRLNTYNSGNANDIEPLFILQVKDIDKVEQCVKTVVKQFQYRKYKEVYEIDIDVLKIVISNCDEFMDGLIKVIENKKKKEYSVPFKKLHTAEHGLYIYVHKQ